VIRPILSRNFAFISKHTISGTSPAADDMSKYPRFFRSSYDIVDNWKIMPPVAAIYVEPLISMPAVRQYTEEGFVGVSVRKRQNAKVGRILASLVPLPNVTRLLTPDPNLVPTFYARSSQAFPYAALLARRQQVKKQRMAAMYVESQAQIGRVQTLPFTVYNATVGEILSEIQRHLLEPIVDGGKTWQLWSKVEVWNYLRERCSRFLIDTGVVTDIGTFPVANGVSDVDLDATLAELRSVWVSGSGGNRALTSQDFWMLDNGLPGWESLNSPPAYYIEDPVSPLSITLVPTPSIAETGTYSYVKSTPLDSPSGSVTDSNGLFTLEGFFLRLPAIFSWAVKYGTMADMLAKEGEANDPQRASYCEQRYQEGVELARLMVGTVSGGQR
jgi:hypothetical protein